MVSLILLTHGDICSSIFNAATTMLGEQPNVFCIPTFHLTPKAIADKINEVLQSLETSKHNTIIAVDLKGGTTWNVACKMSQDKENVAIISGVNLPMLLAFLTKRQNLEFDELVDSLLETGKKGIERF